jgi:hypothetical protein
MTSRDFCYWLQGFIEIDASQTEGATVKGLTERQLECVKKHLSMVFAHEIDPSFPAKQQPALQHLHGEDKLIRC